MIHHVFANRSNAGDWLSARGIQLLLAGLPIREHLCDEPFVPDTLDQLSRLRSDDVVVVGGGGLLMDYFVPFWEGLLEIEARICLWGVGVVAIKREASVPATSLLHRISDRAEVAVVRDPLTAELLGGAHVDVAACPSVVAVPAEPAREPGLLHVANMTTVGEAEYREMRAFGERWAADTSRAFRETSNRHSPDERGLDGVLDLYRSSDVVVSSALHGCLIAVAMGRPVVAVAGDRKIDEMMRQFELDEWLLAQEELDLLEKTVADALERQPRADVALRRARADNARAADAVRSMVADGGHDDGP